MIATFEDIARQALELSPRQRTALAGFLLEVDDSCSDPGIDEAWELEIQNRIKSIRDGSTTGISYDKVMSDAAKHLAP